MYKAKVAVCSEIYNLHKTLNAKRAPCRIFECQTWWYVKKQLGFKRLMHINQCIYRQLEHSETDLRPKIVLMCSLISIHHTMGTSTISSRSVHGQGFGKTIITERYSGTCAHVMFFPLSVFRKLTNKELAVIESLSVQIFFRRLPALIWKPRDVSAIFGTTKCIYCEKQNRLFKLLSSVHNSVYYINITYWEVFDSCTTCRKH